MRIVSLLSSATEILFAIGAGDDVVAISHECDYPPQATQLPRATRSIVDSSGPSHEIDQQVKRLLEAGEALYEIDRDLIRDLQPDLIVTQAQCDVCAVRYQDVIDFVAAEPALRTTNVLPLNPQSLSDVLQDVIRIGEATSRLPSARRFADSLTTRIARIRAGPGVDCENKSCHIKKPSPQSTPDPFFVPSPVSSAPPSPTTPTRSASEGSRPRVVCIEWINPLMTAGNWTPELIDLAGGLSCLATPNQHSRYVTWPDILTAQAEVLLVAPCGFNLPRSLTEARHLLSLPGYHNLPAVTQNRVYILDGNAYLNRSGPRLIDTLEVISHLIHPNLFPPPSGPLSEQLAWCRMPI